MPNIEIRDDSSNRPRRFQFTIRAMLILTATVAVVCSLMFTMPYWAAYVILAFVTFTIPGVLISMLTYGTPYQRTFAIAALVPSSGYCLLNIDHFVRGWHDMGPRFGALFIWVAAALSGLVAVFIRRRLEKRNHADLGTVDPDAERGNPTASSRLDG